MTTRTPREEREAEEGELGGQIDGSELVTISGRWRGLGSDLVEEGRWSEVRSEEPGGGRGSCGKGRRGSRRAGRPKWGMGKGRFADELGGWGWVRKSRRGKSVEGGVSVYREGGQVG